MSFVMMVVALTLALGSFLALAGVASGAVKHEFQGSFNGSDSPEGGLFFILGTAADTSGGASDGDVYVGHLNSETFAGAVDKFDATGAYDGVHVTGSETPQGAFYLFSFDTGRIGSVAVDGSAGANAGDLYVADVMQGVIDRFNEDGSFDCQITARPPASRTPAEAAAECNGATGSQTETASVEPTGLAVDGATGNLYVADATNDMIDVFSPSGAFLEKIADPQITDPASIAVDSNGNLYVANLTSATETVLKFDNGTFDSILSADAVAVATDPANDHVYTFERGEPGQIVEYNGAGGEVGSFGSEQNVYFSRALAVGPDGNVYLGEAAFGPGNVYIYGSHIVPDVTTGPATEVGTETATLSGEAAPDIANGGGNVTSCRFEYGPTKAYGNTAPCSPGTPYSAPTEVSAKVSGLRPSTEYHYRLVVESSGVAGVGEDASFTTFGPPSIGGESATAGTKGATLRAQINPFGYDTTCELQYVDDASFQLSKYATATTVPCSPEELAGGFGNQSVSATIGGLEVDTTYHYRFLATNQAGLLGRADRTFVTFGLESFSFEILDELGAPDTRAGGHPYEVKTSFSLNTTDTPGGNHRGPNANLKDVITELPAGMIGNPTAIPECAAHRISTFSCSGDAQIGTIVVTNQQREGSQISYPYPVFNVDPPRGVAARFGARVNNVSNIFIDVKVRSGGDYGVTATVRNIPVSETVLGSTVTLWGVPALSSHDSERFCPVREPSGPFAYRVGCSSGVPARPFLTNPTSCSGDLTVRLRADSWQEPGAYASAEDALPAITGCDRVPFEPTVKVQPTTSAADSPSGLAVEFDLPQPGMENPAGLGSAHLKDTVVELPEGVVMNPSAANGLEACASSEIALDSAAPAECPSASKVGRVEIETPLLDHPLKGGVYVAKPFDNPFDSLLAIYIAVHDPETDVVVKLAGEVELDPQTGQLTTTFAENPQLPFEHFKLDFFGGPRAPLVTPGQCGTYTTHAVLTGWNGKVVASDSTFDISGDGNGSPCAAPQFKPTLHAGLTNHTAGSSSSFVLRVQRDDIDNEFKTISTTMPPGLLAKVAGVPLCSDAAAAAGNCPAESQIGRVEVGAGAGTNPFYITNGKVYLTEGYKGGPFGLAISVPAVAGPFDLGTVNVRAALQIDPLTAQVTVVSDPMPRILEGIPLQVRDVRVIVDRDGFMQSPTNCNEMSVGATIGSYSDDSATVLNRFQVGECAGLAFAPKISMGFTNRSQVHKRNKPGLDFRLSQKPGEANIKSVTVKLPRSVVLDVNGASGALCEVAQAENGSCPASSIVGHATAATPLLDQPLSGAVYFVRGDNALPNIMVALRGAISINLRSKSKVDKMGRLISTFATVPDAPISQFHLSLGSAGHGVLSVAPDSDLCTGHNSKGKVSIAILGQNGKRKALAFKMRTPCKKARKHRR